MFNQYIEGLLLLRRDLDAIIDNEINSVMHERGNSTALKESLEYKIETARVLQGVYKEKETLGF